MEEMKQKKSWKKGIAIVIAVLLGVLLLAGGFVAWRYLFPSDKELMALAHYKSWKEMQSEPVMEEFVQTRDISWDFSGGFVNPEMAQSLESFSIHTEETQQKNGDGFYRFFFRTEEENILTADQTRVNGTSYVTVDPFTDGVTYSAETSDKIWNMLLAEQGVQTEKKLFDGVDRETMQKYLKDYTMMLYQSLPDGAFSREKDEYYTYVTVSGDAAWLLTDTVTALKDDYGWISFLYSQWETVRENMYEMYVGSAFLMPEITQAEFETAYREVLDGFLLDMTEQNMRLTFTVTIDRYKRADTDTLVLYRGETPVFSLSLGREGDVSFTPYREGSPLFQLEREVKNATTAMDSYLTFRMDVNEFSKMPSETEKKEILLRIHTAKSAFPKETATAPKQAVNLSDLSEQEQKAIGETCNTKLTELLTQLMFLTAFAD